MAKQQNLKTDLQNEFTLVGKWGQFSEWAAPINWWRIAYTLMKIVELDQCIYCHDNYWKSC